MTTALLVAKIVGLAYIVIGLGILINKSYYQKLIDGFMKEESALYLGGLMSFVIGFLIVTYHNVWVNSWVVLVTIIGWLALIKGILLLLAPKAIISISKFGLKNMPLAGILVLILGLIFGYFGFIA